MPDPRQPCIVGLGETPYTRWGGIADRTEFQLACEAIVQASADCGLAPSMIDGFATFSDPDVNSSALQVALGMPRLRFSSSVWGGRGGGPCGALGLAAMAVQCGQADYVAVFRSLIQGKSRRYGQFHASRPHADLTVPFGLFSAAQNMALVLQRYRHQYGFSDEDLAAIALTARANANRNPRAVQYGKPLDLEAYLSSRMISEPFRLLDCCLETDGACALIVTTRERASDLSNRPVHILAALHGSGEGWSSGAMGAHNMPGESYVTGNQRELADDLFRHAGVSTADIDVAQIYDHFSGMVFLALEDFGFCDRGEAPAFVRQGGISWPDGKLPVNTAGGSLSEAYVHGLNHVVEGARQIRGQSTSQVSDARLCLVTGGGGTSPTSAAILGR